MSDLILVVIRAALVNNIVVDRVIGSDPALVFVRKMDVTRGLCLTMLVLLPAVTASAWLLDHWLLAPLHLEYLRLLVFVSTIIVICSLLKLYLHRLNKKLGAQISIFLPFAGINATVLGAMLLTGETARTFLQAVAFGLGSAAGFALILLMVTAATERLETTDVPAPFRGVPILLVTLALISMAFMGFSGLIKI
jgi:electron transport complex protein RnfA